jgi:glycosyltransferase involved in cell wall biosynthesis
MKDHAKPVHVLHVVRTLGRGGLERNLRRVVVDLSRRGIRHSIALLHDQADTIPFPPEVPIYRVITRPRDPRMALGIWRLIHQLRPTVIHARNWGAWPDTALARTVSLPPRPPLIFSYHGMEASTVSQVLRLKFQAVSRITTRIFAVSDGARQLLVEAYGLERERVGVIANGVDAEKFRPRLPGPRAGPRVVIGTVGRAFKIKNLPLLVYAVHRLLQAGLDLELVIAGDGPEEEALRDLGAKLALGDRLKLLGHVDDVPAALHRLDIYVLSSDNEANPNSLLEAMSSALPSVATSVGSVPELLDGGKAGLLVAPGDEAGMAAAIARLVGDEGLRRVLGETARRRILERYSESRMFDAYEALYRSPQTAPLD